MSLTRYCNCSRPNTLTVVAPLIHGLLLEPHHLYSYTVLDHVRLM